MVADAWPRAVRAGVSAERHRHRPAAEPDLRQPEGTRHCLGRPSRPTAGGDWRSAASASTGCGSIRNAACRAKDRAGSRAAAGHGHVLRSGRLDGARLPARSGGSARGDRHLPPMRCRDSRALRWLRRQIHGRRRAGLFRLSACPRGRRRAGGACRIGVGRCGGRPATGAGTPASADRHRHWLGRGRRSDRRRFGAGAGDRRRNPESGCPPASPGQTRHHRDCREHAPADRDAIRGRGSRPAIAEGLSRPAARLARAVREPRSRPVRGAAFRCDATGRPRRGDGAAAPPLGAGENARRARRN
jgi:hypothetical protein